MNRKRHKRRLQPQRKVAIFLLILAGLLILGVLVSTVAHADVAIPSATRDFYVNDFGEVFNEEQKKEMMDRAVELAYKPEGVQVVVTTVKSLDGLSVEDYATRMYRQYGIGRDDKGILILLSTEDRKVRIEVGYGLESYVTDAKAGRFINDYAISYLKNNQFDIGLMNLQRAVVEDLDAHFEAERTTPVPTEEQLLQDTSNSEAVTRSNTTSEEKESGNVVHDSNEESGTAMIKIIALIFLVLVIAYITFTTTVFKKRLNRCDKAFKNESEKYKNQLASKDSEIQSLKKKILDLEEESKRQYSKLSDKNSMLKEELKKLKDRYARALKLHGGLDSEIDRMIQKEIDDNNRAVAADFDKKFSSLTTDEPLKKCQSQGYRGYVSFEEIYRRALTAYEALNKDQKRYVKTNMEELRKRYEEGMREKSKDDAETFNVVLKAHVQNSRGTESNLPTFQKLYRQYSDFDKQTKSFVNIELIKALEKLIKQGEEERSNRIAREEAERRRRKEEEEEERRRRRRQEEEEEQRRIQQSAFDSSGFGGGFDGFGGSSGGGGASSSF